ncbi:porin [Oleomonas cavernae]|nr:porin [Oleomonas cavernae]
MKKILLGTTALATAALLSAGAAQAAAEPVKLTVSGYFKGLIAAGDNGVTDARNVAVKSWDSEIRFEAKGVADNGLTYGARIELEGNTTGNQIDESYLFFQGGFGRLEVGYNDNVANQMHYQAPSPDALGLLGVNSPNYAWGGSTAQTYDFVDNDSAKLIYFTPRMGGFQLGVSYSPDISYNNNAGSVGADSDFNLDDDLAYGSNVAVGLNFNKEFSGVTLGLSATYSWYEAELAPEDLTYFGFGGNVGFGVGVGTLTVGGSYAQYDSDDTFLDTESFDAGVQYAQGPWTVGISYINEDYSTLFGTPTSDGSMWGVSAGGGYQVAPGLDVSLGYIHYDREAAVTTDTIDDTTSDVFILGTGLSF